MGGGEVRRNDRRAAWVNILFSSFPFPVFIFTTTYEQADHSNSLAAMFLKASTEKAMEMNKAKISSDDLQNTDTRRHTTGYQTHIGFKRGS